MRSAAPEISMSMKTGNFPHRATIPAGRRTVTITPRYMCDKLIDARPVTPRSEAEGQGDGPAVSGVAASGGGVVAPAGQPCRRNSGLARHRGQGAPNLQRQRHPRGDDIPIQREFVLWIQGRERPPGGSLRPAKLGQHAHRAPEPTRHDPPPPRAPTVSSKVPKLTDDQARLNAPGRQRHALPRDQPADLNRGGEAVPEQVGHDAAPGVRR